MEIETKNLSNTLINALRKKGLTLQKLAEATGVSERFLESLVEDKFENLPSLPYVRGYLMKVADILDLDGEELWQEYLKDNEAIKRSGKNDRLPENRFVGPKLGGKLLFLIAIVLIFILYIVFKPIIIKDTNGLLLDNLREDITYTDKPFFNISGRIKEGYGLTLNGKRIYPDEDGNFEVQITVQEGFNTLVFGIKKFLGKERKITKQLFYRAPTEDITQNDSR